MRVLYIANARIPTERAHGLQIMKACEALSMRVDNLILVVPRRRNPIKQNSFEYYGAKENFRIVKLPTFDLTSVGLAPSRAVFLLQAAAFAFSATVYCLLKKTDVVYSREPLPVLLASCFKKNCFWESHGGYWNFIVKAAARRVTGISVITKGVKNFFVEHGVGESKILVNPNGVDLSEFDIAFSKADCRKKLGLPTDKKLIVYTGHLYPWKGVGVLLEILSNYKLQTTNYKFVIVGGTKKDSELLKGSVGNSSNILFFGQRPHKEIPYYLRAADVLVLPSSAKGELADITIPSEKLESSQRDTSPLKLFEYMTSGVPIVASDLLSIREIVDESNVFFAVPDSPASFAGAIEHVLNNPEEALYRARSARVLVEKYTWGRRAERLTEFIDAQIRNV